MRLCSAVQRSITAGLAPNLTCGLCMQPQIARPQHSLSETGGNGSTRPPLDATALRCHSPVRPWNVQGGCIAGTLKLLQKQLQQHWLGNNTVEQPGRFVSFSVVTVAMRQERKQCACYAVIAACKSWRCQCVCSFAQRNGGSCAVTGCYRADPRQTFQPLPTTAQRAALFTTSTTRAAPQAVRRWHMQHTATAGLGLLVDDSCIAASSDKRGSQQPQAVTTLRQRCHCLWPAAQRLCCRPQLGDCHMQQQASNNFSPGRSTVSVCANAATAGLSLPAGLGLPIRTDGCRTAVCSAGALQCAAWRAQQAAMDPDLQCSLAAQRLRPELAASTHHACDAFWMRRR